MSLHSKKGTTPTFGDVKQAGHDLGVAMRDSQLDPATLALLIRDCGEAAVKTKPGSTWNPTLGFAPWFSLKIAFPKGERRFAKGVYEAYEKLAKLAATGFDDVPANPNFAGDYLDAKKTFEALAKEGEVHLTRYGKLARAESDPKRVAGQTQARVTQSLDSAI